MHWSAQSSDPDKKQSTSNQAWRQFHKEKKIINSQNKLELKLHSCEKVKHNFTQNHHRPPPIIKNTESEENDFLTFGVKEEFTYKRQTQRLINLLVSICSTTQAGPQLQKAKEIIDSFGKELQGLFEKYISKFKTFQLVREKKQELNKKIILYIDQTFKKEFININDIVTQSPTIRQLTNNSNDSNRSREKQHHPSFKGSAIASPSSEFRYEGKVSQKNSMSKIQSSFNEVNKLLQKVIQPRFIRKSGLLNNSRQSRGDDSSIEDIVSRSIQQRKQRDHSNSSSKQTLYKISRLLNE